MRRTVSLIFFFLTILPASWASASTIPKATFRAWVHVAYCETHNEWKSRGSIYSGGLGITNQNWIDNAPQGFPRNASLATPRQQIEVAMLINAGFGVPDQGGCNGSW
jgi:hypothetical protein